VVKLNLSSASDLYRTKFSAKPNHPHALADTPRRLLLASYQTRSELSKQFSEKVGRVS
jgi:hypothetical protein